MTVPIYNMTDAWTDGSLYTAIKMSITDTSSNAASLFFDFQIAGTSVARWTKTNALIVDNVSGSPFLFGNASGAGGNGIFSAQTGLRIAQGATGIWQVGLFGLPNATPVSWSSTSSAVGTADVFLSRLGAATLQLGAAAAAVPVAQTLATQGSRAGTDTNIGGGNLTVQPGIGTGTGTPSNLVLNGMVGTTTGTGAQAVSAGLTVTGAVTGQVPSVVLGSAAIGTTATDGFLYITTCAGAPSGVPTAQTGRSALVYDTSTNQFWVYNSGWKQPKTPAGAAIVTWQ